MTKSINWPSEFLEEILNEDSISPKIALRPNSIYFDNSYYVKNEVVFIRVNHEVIRKAEVIDELKLYKIKNLPEEILILNKQRIRQKNDAIIYLKSYYNQQVNDETIVTVIKYKNLNIEV